MTVALRLHGVPISTWARTARMACIEKGIEFEFVPVNRASDAYGELHPFRRIPVLEHGDLVVFEGLAVISYIDEAFAGPELQPTDLRARTSMRQWMSLCADYVFRDVVLAIPRDREPSPDELATAAGILQIVDRLIGASPFLVGAQLTLADLYLAPQISNCLEKVPQLCSGLEATNAWFAIVRERESFRATAYDPAVL